MRITAQELRSPKQQALRVRVPDLIRVLIERIAMEARDSEYVDRKSGVSARLTISALESVISAAELRMLRNGEDRTVVRIGDLQAVIPAITGKIELVFEGEQEGPEKVAQHLLGLAVRNVFTELFPEVGRTGRKKPLPADISGIIVHFEANALDLLNDAPDRAHGKALASLPGLEALVRERHAYLDDQEVMLWSEFVLHGLAEHSRIGRNALVNGAHFSDLFHTMLNAADEGEEGGKEE